MKNPIIGIIPLLLFVSTGCHFAEHSEQDSSDAGSAADSSVKDSGNNNADTQVLYDVLPDTGQTDTRDNNDADHSSDTGQSDITAGDSQSDDSAVVDDFIWGWVTVLESQGVGCHNQFHNEWCGPVRAHFAVEQSYPRSLSHQLDSLCDAKVNDGACSLYYECHNQPPSKLTCSCEDPAQYCDQELLECRDYPAFWNAGTVSITGLHSNINMTPDELGLYTANAPATDLFDNDDEIVATTGGQLSPLSLSARGVADLELESTAVEFFRNSATTVSWTPSDDNSRVMGVFLGGWHFPFLPDAAIVCDAPDSAGQFDISANLINDFYANNTMYMAMKFSRVTRYTKEQYLDTDRYIEFIVGSERGVQLILED